MSGRFQLVFESTGALVSKLNWTSFSASVLILGVCNLPFLSCFNQQQSGFLPFPSASMRLRLKRTSSGVECFGVSHKPGYPHFLFFRRLLICFSPFY